MAGRAASAMAAAVLGLMAGATAARADVIDGTWCRGTAQRLTIDGPAVVTPAGHALQGEYARHYFRYVVPAGEPSAGATMEMRLLNEDTMQSRAGGPGKPIDTWHRCSPDISWQDGAGAPRG